MKKNWKKNLKKSICLCLMVILCISQAAPAFAAVSTHAAQIKKLGASMGAASTKKASLTTTGDYWGSWCKTQGLLSTYVGDLNNDKKSELLAVYLKKAKNPYNGREQRDLHIAAYAKSSSGIKKTADIALAKAFDSAMGHYSDLFIYTYKGQRYIGFQNFQYAQGARTDWWVLTLDKKGKFQVKTAVVDPGYTSGVGLYRYSSKTAASKLAEDNSYYSTGKKLYEVEGAARNNSVYISKLKGELSKYGLSVSKKSHTVYNGNKSVMMQMNASGAKKLYEAEANSKTSYTSTRASYKYSSKLTDYTKTASKL